MYSRLFIKFLPKPPLALFVAILCHCPWVPEFEKFISPTWVPLLLYWALADAVSLPRISPNLPLLASVTNTQNLLSLAGNKRRMAKPMIMLRKIKSLQSFKSVIVKMCGTRDRKCVFPIRYFHFLHALFYEVYDSLPTFLDNSCNLESFLCVCHCARDTLYVHYLIYLMFCIYYSSSDSFLIQNPGLDAFLRVFQVLES